MSQIGCLGSIPFVVSDDEIKTIENVQWSIAARFAEHKRCLSSTVTEFSGLDAERFSFDMQLASYLGTNPMSEIDKIAKYIRTGKAIPLYLGEKRIGRYRWTIKDFKVSMKTFGKKGALISATCSISLLEYAKQ